MDPSRYQIIRWYLLAFLAGIALSSFIAFTVFESFIVAGAAAGMAAMWRKKIGMRVAAFLLFFLAVGFARTALVPQTAFAKLQPPPFQLSGTVSGEPSLSGSFQIVTINQNGLLRVRLPMIPLAHSGDTIEGTCTTILPAWTSPQSGKTFPPLCAWSDVHILSSKKFSLNRILAAGRGAIQTIIDRGLPSPASDFLGGLLIGAQGTFSPELKNDFRRAGISHIVAISGYNITLIIAGLWSVLHRLRVPRKRAFWLLVLGAFLFVGLTGASAATVRAAVMGILVLAGQYFGRRAAGWHTLIIAAAAMTAWEPTLLISNVGFQLSVLATAGLLLLAPLFGVFVSTLPNPLGLKDVALQTLSAFLLTAPLIFGVFNTVSLVALPANLVIVPLIPLAMAIGFAWLVAALPVFALSAIINAPLAWVAQALGIPVALFMNSILSLASFFARVPFAQIEIQQRSAAAWVISGFAYAAVGILIIILRFRLRFRSEENKIYP